MNFQFLRTILGGTWHVNAGTYFELMPLRNLILAGVHFEKAEPDASSLPYFVSAERFVRFDVATAADSEELVAVTVFSGPLTRHDQYCGPIGTQRLMLSMLAADKRTNVIGHIMYIDSGGGQTISLDPFVDSFSELKKPVVAFVESIAASAAMGLASFAREIVASKPRTVVGSIGTMIAFDGYPANATSPDGMRHVRLYASKSVKKNAAFEQALDGNPKPIVEKMLNPINEDFISMIRANRPAIPEIQCDGEDYYAEKVVGTMVDAINTFEYAVQRVRALSAENSSKNKNTSTANSQNPNQMVKKMIALTLLAAVAGLDALEFDADGHISLSSDQAEKVNSNLEKVATMATTLKKKEEELATANATITEQATRIAELEKEPGSKPATARTNTDEPGEADALLAFSVKGNSSLSEMLSAFEQYGK